MKRKIKILEENGFFQKSPHTLKLIGGAMDDYAKEYHESKVKNIDSDLLQKAREQLIIGDVSNLFNAENAPTFNEWLTKYFKPVKVSRTYKDKVKGSEHTERFLYRKYARAYKLSI